MCNISDPRILDAYIAITEEEPTDWLILGYRDTRDVISLYASGIHGLSEFRSNLTNEILYGFVRVQDKFIQITYVPDSVGGVRRARALVHSRAVAGILELSHAQFTASTLSDLSDTNVRTRLKLGLNQVPNKPRSVSKRTSFVVQQRRRRSGTFAPSTPASSPSPISERNLKIHLNTTEEPYAYYEDSLTTTPTPSTPTSVASSSYNLNTDTNYFSVAAADNNTFNLVTDDDPTEAMLQFHLSKKRESEEARFRQLESDQQQEIFKREEQSMLQPQSAIKQKELPKWQQELIQRKLKKQQEQQALKDQQPRPTESDADVLNPLLSKIRIPERSTSPTPQTPSPMVQLKSHKSCTIVSTHSLNRKSQSENIAIIAADPEPLSVTPDVKVPSIPANVANVTTALMAGFVSAQTNVSPFWKRRYFVINSNNLLLYKDEMSKHATSTVSFATIERMSPADEDDDTFVPNSYMIYTKQGDSYQLLADDKKFGKQIYATLKQQLISSI